MNTRRLWFAFLVVATVTTHAAAQDKTWVGETILPTKPAKDIKFGDRMGDKEVHFPFSGRWPFKVREEKEGWLRLHDGRREGWVDKADFVRVQDAFAYFDGRLQRNAKDTFALGMRGAYWLEKKEPDKAIADFTAGIALNPKDVIAYHNRGVALNSKKEYDQALVDFDKALKLNPRNTVSYVNRGLAYRNKQQWENAIADYDEAIKLEPRYANAHYGRGVAWFAKREYDKSIKDFDETIKIDPKHVPAFNDRGRAWVAKKEFDTGIKDYNEALRLNPKNIVTYANRAVAYRLTRQYDKAIKDNEEAIKLDAKYTVAISNLAWILATCPEEKYRNGKRAVELATKACELSDWKEPNFIDVLAAAHAEAGQFEDAVRFENQALESERFAMQFGEAARKRLKEYEDKKPHRE